MIAGFCEDTHLAVAQTNRYQHGTLVSGNMDQNLRNPCFFDFEPDPFLWKCQGKPKPVDRYAQLTRATHSVNARLL